jgi:hypothetical protein
MILLLLRNATVAVARSSIVMRRFDEDHAGDRLYTLLRYVIFFCQHLPNTLRSHGRTSKNFREICHYLDRSYEHLLNRTKTE